ncbi:MAG: hypothetical protein EAZ37_11445 [Burkholderiales bacterium]|nr:MAG: hypothetical protein EAZ37_11445 [Burkholderiales bacterium]
MFWTDALGLGLTQAEVDFVIPNLQSDLRLYLDPYLFYRSKNEDFQSVHAMLHEFFETAISELRKGNDQIAKRMLMFPEVKEIMLGHSVGTHSGRGSGAQRGAILFNELIANSEIQKNGIKHIAEMQLMIEGVGPDLISDMVANIAKPFFIDYTQRQCAIYGIPMEKGICLEHIFDWERKVWDDQHLELPVNPLNMQPILLVPKTVVRRFITMDYRDFWQRTYRYMLREMETEPSLQTLGKEPLVKWKDINAKYSFSKATVVAALRKSPELRLQYVNRVENEVKEQLSFDIESVKGADVRITSADEYANLLKQVLPGQADAKAYEKLVLRILTRLFVPPLADPKEQVRSIDGREIKDITFYNSAGTGFWHDMKLQHRSVSVVFEVKNMIDLGNEEFGQLSMRLDDIKGTFGVLVARAKDNLDTQRAYRRLYLERKIVLILTDNDLVSMLRLKQMGDDPSLSLRALYRSFVDAA